jgi:hypothetical protein
MGPVRLLAEPLCVLEEVPAMASAIVLFGIAIAGRELAAIAVVVVVVIAAGIFLVNRRR